MINQIMINPIMINDKSNYVTSIWILLWVTVFFKQSIFIYIPGIVDSCTAVINICNK